MNRCATFLIAIGLLWVPTDDSNARGAKSPGSRLSELLPGTEIENARVNYAGTSQKKFYIKTGGTLEFRGYYVYEIDFKSLDPDVKFHGDSATSTEIELIAIGRNKIIQKADDMHGEESSTEFEHLSIKCDTHSLAADLRNEFKKAIAGGSP